MTDSSSPDGSPMETRAPGHKRTAEQRGGLVRRRRILIGVIGATLALTGVGTAAASLLKSPAQVAAETAPPAPDVLTAPVEKRVLSASLVTRGKVAASQRVEVLSAGLTGPDTTRPVVTKVHAKPGEVVKPGSVLVEVAGRPVLALRGALPSYRNLSGGAVGPDVVQLQQALAELGHRRGSDASGTFGPGTQEAVRALYKAAGYTAPTGASGKADPPAKPDGGKPGETPGKPASPEPPATGSTGSAGVTLPASEVAFVSDGPVRVESVDAVVGTTAGEKLLTLTAGALVVDGALESYQKETVRPDQKVEIFAESTGARAVGTVTAVVAAPAPTAKDAAASAAPALVVKVKPDTALPAEFAGQNVRLTITAAASKGEVLVVPASAVSSGADARTTVTVVSGGGKQTRVEIRPGMTGDGYVEVTPVGGTLAPGNRVVIGVAQAPVTVPSGGKR
ncbi:peptidoglycan-binding protein [Streptomyces sp. DSM 41634]|uniref:peptidoglycan-binding protein n=1 Tax=Streptomyces sp. DSM 41634 TaxID=3448656 RepID=UPI0028878176|nr:peptidoglycan-binding protein [Streptomyces sp. DSM 41633]